MTISEAAKKLQVSITSLRAWERQGKIPKVGRAPCRQRIFTEEDLAHVRSYLETKQN